MLKYAAFACIKAKDFDKALSKLIHDEIVAHKRIVFNGNGYGEEWVKEAKKRGLLNLKTTVDALEAFITKDSIKVFEKHKVYSETEIKARYEILLENYYKTINIEALTMPVQRKHACRIGPRSLRKGIQLHHPVPFHPLSG